MKTPYHNYNRNLKKFARDLRNNSTKAEVRIWSELLSNKKMMGFSFLRQRPIGNFIADFYCKKLNLVIEIDGITHYSDDGFVKDTLKDKYFAGLGINVLRFQDDEVMNELENVSSEIEFWIESYLESGIG